MDRDNKLLMVESVISDSEERWMRVTHEISTPSNKQPFPFEAYQQFSIQHAMTWVAAILLLLVTTKQTCF